MYDHAMGIYYRESSEEARLVLFIFDFPFNIHFQRALRVTPAESKLTVYRWVQFQTILKNQLAQGGKPSTLYPLAGTLRAGNDLSKHNTRNKIETKQHMQFCMTHFLKLNFLQTQTFCFEI